MIILAAAAARSGEISVQRKSATMSPGARPRAHPSNLNVRVLARVSVFGVLRTFCGPDSCAYLVGLR